MLLWMTDAGRTAQPGAARHWAYPERQGHRAAMSPPAFQRAERAAEAGRFGPFVPSPDAALGDGDGAARHPYQGHGNSIEMRAQTRQCVCS